MSNRGWADTPELGEQIVKAEALGASNWSTRRRTELFLAENECQQGKLIHHYCLK